MSKLKWEACEAIAQKTLDGWGVKHGDLCRRLAEIIQREGKVPYIKVFWNQKKQDIDFEVLK